MDHSVPSLVASALASISGTVLIASDHTLPTAGVMIALALIPSAALAGSASVTAKRTRAGQAALRWTLDVGFVTFVSLLAFGWQRVHLHMGKMTF